ncbi:hypothetical protein E4T38_02238 [Aureobasidium subglaciale]|nr:hypothetical protein E4T38_02238 [Aureobasidium subglaciale]KAI5228501.1 hypothetical protein E4T40_02017 [Aureobasidium subglaciale]KAI5231969.1 hypothetical protein E4T41_02237 [Aureobasidium subglaciale]KAI5265728.1 hypothetical protein E4T46_02015 [Aureobasidium subglaciale]
MALNMLRMLGVIRLPITTFTFVAKNARMFSGAPLRNWSNEPEIRRRQRTRFHTDPVYKEREASLTRTRPSYGRWQKANHDAYIKRLRSYTQVREASDPLYVLRNRVHMLVQHAWAMEDLPWKTHVPVLYEQRVQHKCGKCLVSRHGGVKMWWREKQPQGEENGKQDLEDQGQAAEAGDDGNKYLCHSCHFTGPEAMPEGYEDLLKITDIGERKKQLGH